MYSISNARPPRGGALTIAAALAALLNPFSASGAHPPAPTAGPPTGEHPTAGPPTATPLELPAELAAALAAGAPDDPAELRLLQLQVRRVVAAARPATVAVEMNDSVGSGVIISADGLVLTAGHVCSEPNRRVWVRFPTGERVAGRSLGVNHKFDAGLVRITADAPPVAEGAPPPADGKAATGWPHAPLADADPAAGDWVVGLGQPNGYVAGRAPPVRLGRVLHVNTDSISTDATLVGGDSGGPLLNLRGEVVGIHSKIGEAITSNYHVPASAYRREWDRLLAGRMTGAPEGQDPRDWRPLVGLAVRAGADGLIVTQVFPGGPAEESGLAPGDVVESVGGRPVSSAAGLAREVAQREPFERTPVVARRGAERVSVEVWLGRVEADFPGSLFAQEGR